LLIILVFRFLFLVKKLKLSQSHLSFGGCNEPTGFSITERLISNDFQIRRDVVG
jgi:hypothetical protein